MSATLDLPLLKLPADGRTTRRLLLVAYNFPPVGGAGVQRPVKWVKYLQRFGWDVTVLTTLNPSVPVRDESLLADLPADVEVIRARTWEPDYRIKQNLVGADASARNGLIARVKNGVRNVARRCVKLALQPDPQVLWNYNAIQAGSQALKERPHDAILVTAPAYSSFYIGASLKRRFRLPLVLDYRDEWDLSGKYLENAQRDWMSKVIQSRMQGHLLRQADAVVATTRLSTQNLAGKLASIGHQIPARCIYNGFDTEDFEHTAGLQQPANVKPPEQGTFRLVYTGTLWNLTDVAPMVQAIERLDSVHPELAKCLEFVCVGRKTPEQISILERLKNTSARLVSIDYCDHSTVLQWLETASALCLLLSDVPGADRVVPAKLFEYLAVRKQMVAICPAGETADIAKSFFPGGQFTPADVPDICDWLQQRIATPDLFPATKSHDERLCQFSRESQTHQLAELLDSLVLCK